jgi:hypothetical protein
MGPKFSLSLGGVLSNYIHKLHLKNQYRYYQIPKFFLIPESDLPDFHKHNSYPC